VRSLVLNHDLVGIVSFGFPAHRELDDASSLTVPFCEHAVELQKDALRVSLKHNPIGGVVQFVCVAVGVEFASLVLYETLEIDVLFRATPNIQCRIQYTEFSHGRYTFDKYSSGNVALGKKLQGPEMYIHQFSSWKVGESSRNDTSGNRSTHSLMSLMVWEQFWSSPQESKQRSANQSMHI